MPIDKIPGFVLNPKHQQNSPFSQMYEVQRVDLFDFIVLLAGPYSQQFDPNQGNLNIGNLNNNVWTFTGPDMPVAPNQITYDVRNANQIKDAYRRAVVHLSQINNTIHDHFVAPQFNLFDGQGNPAGNSNEEQNIFRLLDTFIKCGLIEEDGGNQSPTRGCYRTLVDGPTRVPGVAPQSPITNNKIGELIATLAAFTDQPLGNQARVPRLGGVYGILDHTANYQGLPLRKIETRVLVVDEAMAGRNPPVINPPQWSAQFDDQNVYMLVAGSVYRRYKDSELRMRES